MMKKFLLPVILLTLLLPLSGQQWPHIISVSATPTITASSAYASGDLVGTKIELDASRVGGGSGIIHALTLTDLGKQDAAFDIVFWHTDPGSTTFTDDATLDVADADLVNLIGWVEVTGSNYADFNDNSVATVAAQGLPFKLSRDTTLYAALVTRGTPTYASTSDLTLTVHIIP